MLVPSELAKSCLRVLALMFLYDYGLTLTAIKVPFKKRVPGQPSPWNKVSLKRNLVI